MSYHIVLPRSLNEEEAAAVEPGSRPRHGAAMLARVLNARLHAPSPRDECDWTDRIRSRLAGTDTLWSMARRIDPLFKPGDVVFCTSEAGGVQVASRSGGRGPMGPRVCMFVHNLDRPRGRAALKLLRLSRKVDLFLACSQTQVEFLRGYLGLPDSRVKFIWDHTDIEFFTPGPFAIEKSRPVIVSVGLEKRDYKTLAQATSDMDVDVKVSGFSEDATVLSQTFPEVIPANMTRKFYPWEDLVQLYRHADVVVVSVHENRYAAGVQSLMEGMACGRPIIATSTVGLNSYLDSRAVVRVPPGDSAAMRSAIEGVLSDRVLAERMGAEGAGLASERHGIERYVAELASHLRMLAAQ